KEIDDYENVDSLSGIKSLPDTLNIEKIYDLPEGEIISATKLSIFYQCPLKYQLTYEYGFTKLMEEFKNWNYELKSKKYEFNPNEENYLNEEPEKLFHSFGNIKGRIIHKILQREIDKSDLKKTVYDLTKEEIQVLIEKDFPFEDFTNDIVSDLIKFYDSAAYSDISKLKNYKSELEVYSKEEDYFLFGIIDRIAFDGNKAIIIDFKTDDIEKDNIPARFDSYLTQLKFYSYIVSRLYKDIDKFELKIIFIKYPDEQASLIINKSELKATETLIRKMVSETRAGVYEKNLNHCPKCIFSVNHPNICIVN
ncbi:MAG TPA: PD-(D/E)XK nuclease family protein, partial [Ignavibacteriaceae bacterium]|nr:PD-(D/E)XK nuclease family protein [Ignavibacteriaceae bacterium]